MTIKGFYDAIGANYDDVVGRLMNDALISRLLKKYLDDTNYSKLADNIEKGDMNEAFLAVHTLKGLALNLGFNKLGEASAALTEYLRDGVGEKQKAEELFKPITEEHEKIIELIKQLD